MARKILKEKMKKIEKSNSIAEGIIEKDKTIKMTFRENISKSKA